MHGVGMSTEKPREAVLVGETYPNDFQPSPPASPLTIMGKATNGNHVIMAAATDCKCEPVAKRSQSHDCRVLGWLEL